MRFIFTACLCSALALAFSPPAVAQKQPTFKESRDQGILYFKKGRFKRAKASLDQAYATPQGKLDGRTLYYRGQAAQKLLLLDTAFEMLDAAEQIKDNDDKLKAGLAEFKNELNDRYGAVHIKAGKGETNKQGRIFLEAKTGIINKEKKRVFMSIRERFRALEVSLPRRIYLPYGDYLANNVPFTISKGEQEPTVEVFLQIVKQEQESPLWWYVGIGGATAVAAGLGAFFLLNQEDPEVRARLNPQFVGEGAP
ncbi:hypothetical protein KKF91_05755 [Myxococcota bacterium]|nr:hypothetical protein [Myxococcota bacterium]MBU1430055.1 hypothetical protein [Myxococcota bacterium]MBU1896423.1 hypothetical protein [Myxococcota bacterium]